MLDSKTGLEFHIETCSGNRINILTPDSTYIDINDIAYSLSGIARFNRHTRYPEDFDDYTPIYSVAHHSYIGANLINSITKRPDFALAFLLHDAHEAYTNDIPGELKKVIRMYTSVLDFIEERLDQAIQTTLGLPTPYKELIKEWDSLMLFIEAFILMPSKGIGWQFHPSVPALYDQVKTKSNMDWIDSMMRISNYEIELAFLQLYQQLKKETSQR